MKRWNQSVEARSRVTRPAGVWCHGDVAGGGRGLVSIEGTDGKPVGWTDHSINNDELLPVYPLSEIRGLVTTEGMADIAGAENSENDAVPTMDTQGCKSHTP